MIIIMINGENEPNEKNANSKRIPTVQGKSERRKTRKKLLG